MADKVLEEMLAFKKKADKDFGEGAVIVRDGSVPANIEVSSTGNALIDQHVLGVGGWPRGRIAEVFGPESSGKTTLMLTSIAEFQRANPDQWAAFVDVEHALDESWARTQGVDWERLTVSQPSSGEEALRLVEMAIIGRAGFVVMDSIAALVTKQEIEADIGACTVGAQARLMSASLRKLQPLVGEYGTTVIFTNQIREKIGVMFGSPETTPGGHAMKFYSSIRLRLSQSPSKAETGEDGDRSAVPITVKCIKNKVAPPFRKADVWCSYGTGIDNFRSLVEMAVNAEVIAKKGSWFSYKDKNLAQGAAALTAKLKEDKELADEILEELKNASKKG